MVRLLYICVTYFIADALLERTGRAGSSSNMFAPAMSPMKVKSLNRTGISKPSISPHDDGMTYFRGSFIVVFADNAKKSSFLTLGRRISNFRNRLWMILKKFFQNTLGVKSVQDL